MCDMDFKNFLLGLVICFLLSFLLGLERQYRRRFLGLRTMILVSVGSYLFVSFSFLLSGYQTDASRIAAQVVAGIGFLGAGVIIKDNKNSKVRGLTTAATLWCDASIGVLCAGGFVKEAIVASVVVLYTNVAAPLIPLIILETFSIDFSISSDKIDEARTEIISFIDKTDYLETDSYEMNKGRLKIDINVRKSDLLKFDRLVDKVVKEYDITNYSVKKISESKLDDNEEL